MKPRWAISIRTHTSSKMVVLEGQEDETALDFYRNKVKPKAQEIRQIYADKGITVTVDIISRQIAFKPPKDIKAPKNHYWCPYCTKHRIFVWNEVFGVKKCSICGISEEDYYVKLYNGLTKLEYEEALAKMKMKDDRK